MAVRQPSETLDQRANFLRDSIQKSQFTTEKIVSSLGSFDRRFSDLESAIRPTQVRTNGVRIAHQNINKIIKSSDTIIAQFNLSRQAEENILKGPHGDLNSYLEAMDQLRKNVSFFSNNKNINNRIDEVLTHSNGLLAKGILMLEEEFRRLLASCSKPVELECLRNALRSSTSGSTGQTSDSNGNTPVHTISTLIPSEILPRLRDIAKQLFQAGCQEQCLEMYRECRAPILQQALKKLGVEKCSKEEVQKMQWAVLAEKIRKWIQFMSIAVELLFAGERTICDQIFKGINSLKERCFAEVTAKSVATLLSFGYAVAKNKGSSEKLFLLLDMYEVMRELKPEIDTIFGAKACTAVLTCASKLTKRLVQNAVEILNEFEAAVKNDTSKTEVQDGTVHPLTSYVINYVKFLFDYQSTLKQLFHEFKTEDESNSQIATITMRIMHALKTNLEEISKQYTDPSLTLLFLMNNVHYMVRSALRPEANDFLGDDWVQRHRRIVQQNAYQYKKVAWNDILQTLIIQSAASSLGDERNCGNGISRSTVKQRFRSFNMQFDKIYRQQTQWNVPDLELRESLKLSIAEILLPAYRSFVKQFGPFISNGRSYKYMKYTPNDLDRMLGDFFEGKASYTDNFIRK